MMALFWLCHKKFMFNCHFLKYCNMTFFLSLSLDGKINKNSFFPNYHLIPTEEHMCGHAEAKVVGKLKFSHAKKKLPRLICLRTTTRKFICSTFNSFNLQYSRGALNVFALRVITINCFLIYQIKLSALRSSIFQNIEFLRKGPL
jgi:hypothetical protein